MNVTQLMSALGMISNEDDSDGVQYEGYEAQGRLDVLVFLIFRINVVFVVTFRSIYSRAKDKTFFFKFWIEQEGVL